MSLGRSIPVAHRSAGKLSSGDLIMQHEPLVRRIAKQVYKGLSQAIEIDDLVQVGMIALIEAASRYEDRGFQFSSYASLRIRGHMIDQLRRSAILSVEARRTRRTIDEVIRDLAGRCGGTPHEAAIAAEMKMSAASYRALADATVSPIFGAFSAADVDYSLEMVDPDEWADDLLDRKTKAAALATHIAALSEKEQLILQLFFVDEQSLNVIGEVLGITGARVCQIKKQALDKLASPMRVYH